MKWISRNGYTCTSLLDLTNTDHWIKICDLLGLKSSSSRIRYLIQYLKKDKLIDTTEIIEFENLMFGDKIPVNGMLELISSAGTHTF
jgi:hypothetical protein